MLEICTCHYKEDLDWLKDSEYKVSIVHKEGGTPVNYTYCIPNKGNEVSAYLTYIIERYDTLPDHVAFLHGHETAHHQLGDRPMLDMIRTAKINEYDMIPLNNAWRLINTVLLPDPNKICEKLDIELPLYILTCCGAQFIVSKKYILRNSKERYIQLLENCDEPVNTVVFEFIWNYIFTGFFCMLPKTRYFEPPLDEILYSSSNKYFFWESKIIICNLGKNKSNRFINITNEQEYLYYLHRAAKFIIHKDDEFEYKPEDENKITYIVQDDYDNIIKLLSSETKLVNKIIGDSYTLNGKSVYFNIIQ